MRTAARGLSVDVPAGWEARIVRPPESAPYLHVASFALTADLGQFGAGVKTGVLINTRFGTLAPWVEAGGLGTVGNTKASAIETLGLLTAGETATVAPQGAVTAGAGVDLTGQGPWSLSAQWGGQYGSATSAENFAIEGRYSF